MNRGSTPALGYTIVETLIFLAVTGAMFVSAMVLISGQQGKTEFRNAVKEFELRLLDIAGNVSSGYYTNTGSFKCSAPLNGAVNITTGVNSQGQNIGCVYVGRVIQFGNNGTNGEGYRLYSAVGRQFQPGSTSAPVASLSQSLPRLIAAGTTTNTSVPNAFENGSIGGGVTVGRVQYVQAGLAHDTGSVGFFSSFQGYDASGSLSSGGMHIDLVVPSDSSGVVLDQTGGDFVDKFDALTMSAPDTVVNPDGGLKVCLNSNTSGQYAWVNLGGGSSGKLTTSVDYSNGRCP